MPCIERHKVAECFEVLCVAVTIEGPFVSKRKMSVGDLSRCMVYVKSAWLPSSQLATMSTNLLSLYVKMFQQGTSVIMLS